MDASLTAIQPVRLNGWDYVLAFEESQVNQGLRMAHAGPYTGPEVLRLPPGEQQVPLDPAAGTELHFVYGCPQLATGADDPARCELRIPLEGAAVMARDGAHPLPPTTCLRIQATLACTRSALRASAGRPGCTRYEAFIDYQSPLAVYRLRLGDAPHDPERPVLASVLRRHMQAHARQLFRFGAFDAPLEASEYTPRRIELSFVRDAGRAGRHGLLICASLDAEGPPVNNRLVFDAAGILPPDVPAAMWVGPGVVLDRLVRPMVADSIATGHPGKPELAYDAAHNRIELKKWFSLGEVEHHATHLSGLVIAPEKGTLTMTAQVHVDGGDDADFDADAKSAGHITLALTADHQAFSATSAVDATSVDVHDRRSAFERWVSWICSFGFGKLIENGICSAIRSGVGNAVSARMGGAMKPTATQIDQLARRIPAMEDLAAGGHLVFTQIGFTDEGAAYLGIARTALAGH